MHERQVYKLQILTRRDRVQHRRGGTAKVETKDGAQAN